MLKTTINEKIITGSPVPIENMAGNKTPSEYFKASGISIPKNKTAENGQNASANNAPNKKLPKFPFSESLSFIILILFPSFSEGSLIIFSITSPMKINKGPKSFSPYLCKKKETACTFIPMYTMSDASRT